MIFDKYSISRSYRVILPSSFNIVISYAFIYSISSPVSDLIRFIYILPKNNRSSKRKIIYYNFYKQKNRTKTHFTFVFARY